MCAVSQRGLILELSVLPVDPAVIALISMFAGSSVVHAIWGPDLVRTAGGRTAPIAGTAMHSTAALCLATQVCTVIQGSHSVALP